MNTFTREQMDRCLERLGKAFSNYHELNNMDNYVSDLEYTSNMYSIWEIGAFGEDFDYKSLGEAALKSDAFQFDEYSPEMHKLMEQLKESLLSDETTFSFDLDSLDLKNKRSLDKLLDYKDVGNTSYMFIAPLFSEIECEDFKSLEPEKKTYQYLDNGMNDLFNFKIKTSYNLFVGNQYLGTADNLGEAVKLLGDYVHGVFSELGSYFRERINSKIVEVCEKVANAAKDNGGYWDEAYEQAEKGELEKWGYTDALQGLDKLDELKDDIENGIDNMSVSEYVKRASTIMQTYCDTFIKNLNELMENEKTNEIAEDKDRKLEM